MCHHERECVQQELPGLSPSASTDRPALHAACTRDNLPHRRSSQRVSQHNRPQGRRLSRAMMTETSGALCARRGGAAADQQCNTVDSGGVRHERVGAGAVCTAGPLLDLRAPPGRRAAVPPRQHLLRPRDPPAVRARHARRRHESCVCTQRGPQITQINSGAIVRCALCARPHAAESAQRACRSLSFGEPPGFDLPMGVL